MPSLQKRGSVAGALAALAAATLFFTGAAALAQTPPAAAGGQPPDPFTVQNLIGDAVSLSNQTYPDVEKAIQRFKNGDVEGARGYLEQARKQYPKLPPTELSMAKLHLFARDEQNGRAMLEQTVTKNPDDPEAYLLLADIAFTQGRTTESAALFDVAASLVQKFNENEKRRKNFDIRVLAGRSAVLERRLKWDQAAALLAKWVELDPDSANAHTRLGITLARLKKPTEAFEEFRKARDLRPDSPHPYVMLGQIYASENDMAKARESFEKAYAEDAKSESTARAYAEWLIQQKELDKAQQVAKAMRQASPDSIVALTLDGVVAKMRNQPKEAEEALTRVLALDPSNAGATNLLALILGESSNAADQEKALRHAQVNAERFPQNSQTNITLAWILYKLGRAQEGAVALQRGGQAGNINADTAYLVARILIQQNQRENARKALEEVLTRAGSGMFMYRTEAENLLKELGGTVPAPQAGGATATPSVPTETPGVTPPAGSTSPTATPGTTPAPGTGTGQ
jgi:predicted Zn-dependent protease